MNSLVIDTRDFTLQLPQLDVSIFIDAGHNYVSLRSPSVQLFSGVGAVNVCFQILSGNFRSAAGLVSVLSSCLSVDIWSC